MQQGFSDSTQRAASDGKNQQKVRRVHYNLYPIELDAVSIRQVISTLFELNTNIDQWEEA